MFCFQMSFETQSPASTGKESDSGCCADMSNHEDNGNHLHMNGKKILSLCGVFY